MSNNTILVVDDEVGIRELLSEILRDEGYRVALAENAAQARAWRKQARPDLVLLDIGLPKLDGLDVLSQIKSDAALKDIPVVIFSTSTAAASLQTAYERQANSYVVKPSEFQAYMAAIESIEAYWARTATVPGHASAGES